MDKLQETNMKSTKTTKSYVKYVRYYIIRWKFITLEGEN